MIASAQQLRFSQWLMVLVVVMLILAPSLAFAQGLPDKLVPDCSGPDCNLCHLVQLAQNILNAGIAIAVFIATLLFAWAGWLYLSNMGDSGRISKAKGILVNVLVGLVLILAAWLIVDTLMQVLVTGDFQWNEIGGLSC